MFHTVYKILLVIKNCNSKVPTKNEIKQSAFIVVYKHTFLQTK